MTKLATLKLKGFEPARCLRCGQPTSLPRGEVGIGYEGVATPEAHQHMEALHALFSGKHLCWNCFMFLAALLEAGLKAENRDELDDMVLEIEELLDPFAPIQKI